MYASITGTAKEVADLVLELQGRQPPEVYAITHEWSDTAEIPEGADISAFICLEGSPEKRELVIRLPEGCNSVKLTEALVHSIIDQMQGQIREWK